MYFVLIGPFELIFTFSYADLAKTSINVFIFMFKYSSFCLVPPKCILFDEIAFFPYRF